MPLVPRPAGPAGPTGTWPSVRGVLPLTLLCLGLGWLWAAAPVVAQDQIPPPAAEATGPYRNLAENHAGAFHLRREGVSYTRPSKPTAPRCSSWPGTNRRRC